MSLTVRQAIQARYFRRDAFCDFWRLRLLWQVLVVLKAV